MLRTPLTWLRLELEDLTLRDDVPEDVQEAAARVHPQRRRGQPLGRRAGRPVPERGSLVEGAELTLRRPGHPARPALGGPAGRTRRPLTASAEGDLPLAFTPGPVEHVLDLVLADIVQGGKGPVKIMFLGEDDHLRIKMPAGVVPNNARRRRGRQPGVGLAEAREVVEAQGGRITGDGQAQDLEILLPRR